MQIQIKYFAHNFTDKKQGREDKLFYFKAWASSLHSIYKAI